MKRSIITQNKALELIREKYPTANYWFNENEQTYNIAYMKGGKVYSYKAYNTLCFLQRIKVINENVMYKKDYDNYVKSLNKAKQKLKDLEEGRLEYYLMSKEQIFESIKQEIQRLTNIIETSKILDI